MTSTKDFASRAVVAVAAIAMAFSVFAAPAKAQSTEDLQKMINDLLAQVAALQGKTGSASAAGVCPFTWTRDLKTGATGADVKALQQFLNANADTRVAATGVGSAGMETEYFGPATAAAVSKFQVMYRADVLTPAGLTNPTGFFGPGTRAKANALCVASSSTDDEDEDDSTSGDLSGEASLDSVEVDDADETDVEEGQSEVEVAEITAEFADGDASISRLDIAVTDSEGTDSDAWDVFESFSLWVDGEMVAEASASDEDDYLGDEDNGVIRFSGLDIVGMEDEEVVITVAATINDNLEAAELGEWDVKAVSVRYFDADGVATTEGEYSSMVSSDVATFTIEVEGAGDDLDLKSSTNDIDATTLALEEDEATEHEVFIFKLDADDSDGDLTIEGLTIDLALGSTTRDLNEVVKDVMVEIDGETFSAEDFDGSTDTEAVDFDINGDVTIEAGEEVEVTVTVEFEDMDDTSTLQGVTLTASVDTTDVDVEGESGETVTLGGSDQSGDAHVLRSQGLVLELTSITETESTKSVGSSDLDYGKFVYKFEATAFGDDFYMDEDSDIVNFVLEIDGVASTTGYTATLDIADADDASTADFMIAKGEVASFTLTIETNTGHQGEAQVRVTSVDYSAADDATEELNVTATPADDWESGKLLLN